ncbi:MAG: hypothetical protein ACYC5M_03390 [Anaerolineae bacterium]
MEATTLLRRKHMIARMNGPDLVRHKRCRERQRVYDAEVAKAIAIIADALDWICAKRLVACGEMQVSAAVLDKLQPISEPPWDACCRNSALPSACPAPTQDRGHTLATLVSCGLCHS